MRPTNMRMGITSIGILSLMLACARTNTSLADAKVRVASYNIWFLSENLSADRIRNLQETLAELNADVIGLQEIQNRRALQQIFDPRAWELIIDDDSEDDQDVALAVRKPLRVLRRNGQPIPGGDAEDVDFLFSGRRYEEALPNRRDGLCVQVVGAEPGVQFLIIVNHWKSRRGGRSETDHRRDEAAQLLVERLKSDLARQPVILVGDFNDNPDDRSLNVLETGDPLATAGPEELDGALLVNVMEPLVARNQCSWGIRSSKSGTGTLNPTVVGSRRRNNEQRGTPGESHPILIDQILFTLSLKPAYVPDSAAIFAGAVARAGSGLPGSIPSDHLPVFADFVFGSTSPPVSVPQPTELRIVRLMVNPQGEDRGREWVEIINRGGPASLAGWSLRDESGNVLPLSGEIGAKETVRITDPDGRMPLNNTGDTVELLNRRGVIVHRAVYQRDMVLEDEPVVIP